MKRISTTDITLKTISWDRSVSLLFREKFAIASCADRIGADAISLPGVKNAREDAIIYKTIAKNVQSASLTIPVGYDIDGVKEAWECIKDAKSPVLQIELPVSTIQMEYTYHVKQAVMLEKIANLVSAAKEYCNNVEFAALDATRADEDFLISAVKTAEEKGATVITVCDSAGVSTPAEIGAMIAKVKAAVSVPGYAELSNRAHMAVASAFAAIENGADGFKCAMVGKHSLLSGEICDAMSICSGSIDAEIALDRTKIHSSIDDMCRSISHDQSSGDTVVSEAKKILLDSDSNLTDVSSAASLLGYELSDADIGNVFKALKQVCEKKGDIGAKEFEALIASSAMQAPSTYHFENYTTTSRNLSSSMTQITLSCNGEKISGVSDGEGPIDSAFRAIEQCIGHHYELDDYQVQSVTEGKEALGSALVRLRVGGKLYSGNGTSTDIVAASIRAYINALNKIVFEEA